MAQMAQGAGGAHRKTVPGAAGQDPAPHAAAAERLREAAEEVQEEVRELYVGYAPGPRPFGEYAGLIALFNGLLAGFLLLSRWSGRPIPERVAPGDVVLLGVATHKLSRLLTKEKVTSALRAPFSRYEEPGPPGEVEEAPRGRGLRHAIGELVTCPYCIGMWLAALFHYGLVLRPSLTRFLASIFASLALSDFLHAVYVLATARAQES
jgi:hypothetical protein